ncbi:glycosyltransferase family 4 protein [Pontibacter diazotrophicus]|uniref:glycosyltransferase family 4 protein n=1 Tax=Pontibacter diazotrophicus TaxID=1400979 RepID=UPI001FE41E4D|nr:glycosyltransferase family 4 protein [Pontibacter diazotrophicus]
MLQIKVFYTLGKSSEEVIDKGFGKKIAWDIPLLEGYAYQFLDNTSKNPGTSYFKGVINPTIIQDIENFKPTDLLVFGWSFDSHLKVLKYFKNKVNVYFRGDSNLLDEKKGFRLILRRLTLTWTYRYIDKALYVGKNNKAYFLKHGIKEQNLIFAPHAIDNARFGDDLLYQNESNLIRKSLGIPETDTVFLFTGKFEKKKNPFLLINAFKKLNRPNTSLLLVGNGVLEADLKEEAMGFANIYFLPFQNQSRMPAVYRAGNVVVLPSSGPGETWGLCINEGMACGLPVVASNKVGCAVDLVHESENGFIFDSNSEASLVKKLAACATKTKEELKEMGSTSRAIITNWSFEHICDAITKALHQTV